MLLYRLVEFACNLSFVFRGYGEAEGDARRIHPKLRPPVQREELEIDERTGMKVPRSHISISMQLSSNLPLPEIYGNRE
jgi:hypothetical protein